MEPEILQMKNVKTFWVAEKNDDKQWLEIDLQKPGKVYAIQVNYHDYKSDLYGRVPNLFHKYLIERFCRWTNMDNFGRQK